MHRRDDIFSSSPTDLANFLACRHKTALDLLVVVGQLRKPEWEDPLVNVLRERGIAHEKRYVDALHASGLTVVDLGGAPPDAEPRAIDAMRAGADVIVQAPLRGNGWFGYADVLRRVERPSPAFGAWSYEAQDTKLSRETKGGTILQLCVYSDLLAGIQGRAPTEFCVITPEREERYRVDDFAAFFRWVKAQYAEFVAPSTEHPALSTDTYPHPVEHCEVCRWWDACNARRRKDDHLTFVAGLGRAHQTEWETRDVMTLAVLAGVPVPLEVKPKRGARATYEKQREQARLQLAQRTTRTPTFELLSIEAGHGLAMLPEPSAGDLFLDLEGDPFAREGGREYLFGLARLTSDGGLIYSARWAHTDDEERAAFESVMDEITAALASDPNLHVYHYAAYEPSAFKRLAGRYATREEGLDVLLRGGRFIDLYAAVRQGLRAGVESYSIKYMEPFYRFLRDVELARAADQRRIVEIALETGDVSVITADVRDVVVGYNRDDVRSTRELRDWLEQLRAGAIASGAEVPRPQADAGEPTDKTRDRDRRAVALREQLLVGIPTAAARTDDEQARWLLAYLVDWHRREERVAWGEYHRLRVKPDDELFDEPGAIVGLEKVERLPQTGPRVTTVVDRYRYPVQELDIRKGDELRLSTDVSFGTVAAIDKAGGTIDIKKTKVCTDLDPWTVIAIHIVSTNVQEESIQRIAERVVAHGLEGGASRVTADLLCARPPRLRDGSFARRVDESFASFAVRCALTLDETVLPIQGPPGAGKTYTGAQMIAALVADGRKVGVVATGHKVIRKLIVDAVRAARAQGLDMPAGHKRGDDELPATNGVAVDEPKDNPAALAWLQQAGGRVLGGTAWLWARPECAAAVDVLFVDEAGQMSLANVLAVSQAARSLVLLGDPQQLEQPQKGSHPDGVDVSALEHLLRGHQTMPDDRGIFLPETFRLAPALVAFTSEMFYEGKLHAAPERERQRLDGTRFAGAGVWTIDVPHEGNRNASDEEVVVVQGLVHELCATGSTWTDYTGATDRLTLNDILVVAPYNAQVARLRDALPAGARVGTVDKFQGQEAPAVIYSMATSHPGDAPRGMEFLYSRNRLNVATSRAKCACILVASPALFEPECRTPRQMQLANALCRFRELAERPRAHKRSEL